jgi:hypothetical protein
MLQSRQATHREIQASQGFKHFGKSGRVPDFLEKHGLGEEILIPKLSDSFASCFFFG